MGSADSSFTCPSCSGHLKPTVLSCESCATKVEGNFALNEFADLSAEDLNFLRVFIRSEGKVREMETALGLSYPTVRSRIAEFKSRIVPREPVNGIQSIPAILERLEKKEISFDDAMKAIRKAKGTKP